MRVDMFLAVIDALLQSNLRLLQDVLCTLVGIVPLDDRIQCMIATHRLGLFNKSQLSVSILQRLLTLFRCLASLDPPSQQKAIPSVKQNLEYLHPVGKTALHTWSICDKVSGNTW